MYIVLVKEKIIGLVWTMLFVTIVYTTSVAQGITFSKQENWQDIVRQANAEGKFIFVDCYATWCHPCRLMAAQVFSDDSVGSFMRDRFISVKLQMDSTKGDDDFVKNWHADANHIQSAYQVRSYPTLLYFDPNGQIVHKSVGAVPAREFLRISADALVSDRQYYSLLQKLSQGDRSEDTYIRAFTAAAGANEMLRADSLFRLFWEACDPMGKSDPKTLSHVARFIHSTTDPVFPYLLKASVVDTTSAYRAASMDITRIVKKLIAEEITALLTQSSEKAAIDHVDRLISHKYPIFARELLVKSKLTYHEGRREWREFVTIIDEERRREGANITFDELMNYAYQTFYHCSGKQYLKIAESWLSVADPRDEISASVIRSLLRYRLGEHKEAINMMNSAIAKLTTAGDTPTELQHMLSRMNKGEVLWSPE